MSDTQGVLNIALWALLRDNGGRFTLSDKNIRDDELGTIAVIPGGDGTVTLQIVDREVVEGMKESEAHSIN